MEMTKLMKMKVVLYDAIGIKYFKQEGSLCNYTMISSGLEYMNGEVLRLTFACRVFCGLNWIFGISSTNPHLLPDAFDLMDISKR